MINQQLLDFIKQQLQSGLTKEVIYKQLLDNGWTLQDVEEGFNALTTSPSVVPPVFTPPTTTSSPVSNIQTEQTFISQWSWGGFLLSFFYFLGSRNYSRAFLYFLGWCVPILNIWLWIKGGLRGRKLVWESGKWTDFDPYQKRQKLLDKIGIWCFFVFTLVFIALIASAVLYTENTAQDRKEANLKANMSQIRIQAEWFYNSNNNSYLGLCSFAGVIASGKNIENLGGTGFVCNETATAYAVGVNLPTKNSGGWCVDSIGTNENTTILPVGAICPGAKPIELNQQPATSAISNSNLVSGSPQVQTTKIFTFSKPNLPEKGPGEFWAPYITKIDGSVVLKINEKGTWHVDAEDPEGGKSIYFKAEFNDPTPSSLNDGWQNQLNSYVGNGAFVHFYSKPGTYTIDFMVRNEKGGFSQKSIQVSVK